MKGGGEETQERGGKSEEKVQVHKLYAYADGYDGVLMVLGSVGALLAGASLPFAAYVFGNVLDSMPWSDAHTQLHLMSQVLPPSFYNFPFPFNFPIFTSIFSQFHLKHIQLFPILTISCLKQTPAVACTH